MTKAPLAMIESVSLPASDGYVLAATRYAAQGHLVGNLIVAAATGVRQRFYRRFAEHASRRGFNVLTLDYRGLGASAPPSLKGFEMRFADWARLDLAAAVDFMADGRAPLLWVGHSFGGQAIGLLPNHHKLTAACCLGTGAGWAGWMPWREALKVRLIWSCVLPLIVAWKGYMAWSLLGMGDDLPLGVYRDWRRWCSYPHYFFDDPQMPELACRYAEVRLPCLFANAVDDLWAPPASRDAFIRGYRNATVETRELSAGKDEPIGHMGYFRPSATALWDEILDWLARHAEAATRQPHSGTAGS